MLCAGVGYSAGYPLIHSERWGCGGAVRGTGDYQGGSELAFEMKSINREMVIVIQGLIILFSGALEHMFRPRIEAFFKRKKTAQVAEA